MIKTQHVRPSTDCDDRWQWWLFCAPHVKIPCSFMQHTNKLYSLLAKERLTLLFLAWDFLPGCAYAFSSDFLLSWLPFCSLVSFAGSPCVCLAGLRYSVLLCGLTPRVLGLEMCATIPALIPLFILVYEVFYYLFIFSSGGSVRVIRPGSAFSLSYTPDVCSLIFKILLWGKDFIPTLFMWQRVKPGLRSWGF